MSTKRDGLRDAQELAVVEEVLAELRHDVRNKLSAIGQASEYLRRRVEPTELWTSEKRVPRFFEVIDEQLRIVDGMLDAGAITRRVHARRPAQLDATSVAASAAAGASLGGASLELSVVPGALYGEPHETVVALRQLLDNAGAAAPAGSVVRLTGGPAEMRAYVFAVHDDGPGLSEEAYLRLLRPFASTDAERRGIGLPVARRIAQRWGGDVRLVACAKGTTFELVLSAHAPEVP